MFVRQSLLQCGRKFHVQEPELLKVIAKPVVFFDICCWHLLYAAAIAAWVQGAINRDFRLINWRGTRKLMED